MNFKDVLKTLKSDNHSIELIAEYLGYQVGLNPVNADGDWRIYFSPRVEDKEAGVMAIRPVEELSPSTSTMEIRKLYQQVTALTESFGGSFAVSAVAFVGQQRLVVFPATAGNRDTRLDLNPDTITKNLYLDNLEQLKDANLKLEEDIFFGGYTIKISDAVFRKELTTHFLSVVAFYRKKLSELITGSDLKNELEPLLYDNAKIYLHHSDLNNLIQEDSYTSSLAVVVDTLILRQLMRRFLEGYYGPKAFEVNNIALGVGSGTMDEAIQQAVDINSHLGDEQSFKKLNRKPNPIQEIDLFEDLFNDDEIEQTSNVNIKAGKKEEIAELTKLATEQFRLAYHGDLFAGSVAEVTNKIDARMAKEFPEITAKLWADTASGNYSFRYQDMPPEALEKQYEESMSKDIQIKLDDENQNPIVFYGDDKKEQKDKGAYYTDQRFVNYMVNQTVNVEFEKRFDAIKAALDNNDSAQIIATLDHLLDLKVADFTAGGGSFLRGAFLKLAGKYELLTTLNLPDDIVKRYPMLTASADGQYQWEKYVLEHMIYGVDIDYKAIIIASLTLTLSSLENHPHDTKLPELIGRTLIHQNTLINAVPYYKREEAFTPLKKDIAKLRQLKQTDFAAFEQLRKELQTKVIKYAGPVAKYAEVLHIEAIELNLPEVFFEADGTLKPHGGMDVIIGNPPWENWEANPKEFFGSYDSNYTKLTGQKKKDLQKELIAKFPNIGRKWKEETECYDLGSDYFKNECAYQFQSWKVGGRKTSSDKNLYKIAVERFTQLLGENGYMSILVQANLATDSGATGLRHLLFDNYHVVEFLSFTNKDKVFRSVGGSIKFAVLTVDSEQAKTNEFSAFFYQQSLDALINRDKKLKYKLGIIRQRDGERLALFEARSQEDLDLYLKLRYRYPSLKDTGLLNIGTDFHEAKDLKYFESYDPENLNELTPLYKGGSINQFSIFPTETAIKESIVNKKKNGEHRKYRLTFRNIARGTDRRTLIATLLPKNSTGVTSLLIEKDVENVSLNNRLFYLGVLNSYVMDFIIRPMVGGAHVTQGIFYELPLPQAKDFPDAEEIVQLTKALLLENTGVYDDLNEFIPGDKYIDWKHDDLIAELNARVMLNFGVSREEVLKIMKNFETIRKNNENVRKETQRIINVYDRLVEERNHD
ncbi:Eco57I restriction-modification methylase domain-containing protein [Limosilactobacillus ingluviei]|uniref:Eco57I restriction-modification methylase domain-containing protein n=1 Tax=Limosilactobacillus ingluviei TaxID=148604 RepID=UPI0024BB2E72|nr:restriction endonuclease [Limosilactobacillus ingluviei]